MILIAIIISILVYRKHKNYIIEAFLVINDKSLYMGNNSTDKMPVEIKYQVPVPVNQLNDTQLADLDTNILRNTRVLKLFSQTDELDAYQMYNILKQQKNQSYNFKYDKDNIAIDKKAKIINNEQTEKLNSGAINSVDLELFTRIKLEIISAFNNIIINNEYYINYHPYDFFKIINSNLISFNKKKNTTNEYNYCMTLTFAREYKYQQFVIYYDLDLKQLHNLDYTIVLNKVELSGIPVTNNIEFHNNNKTEGNPDNSLQNNIEKIIEKNKEDETNTKYKDQVSDNLLYDIMPVGENSKLFQKNNLRFINETDRSDMDLSLFDTNSISYKIDEKIMNISKDQHYNNHKCFGLVNGVNKELPQYKNPISCTSYHPDINQNGIWDAPCQVNTDCPFYNANKNYPNEYGKCDKLSGICEMPQGVIALGFTKYGKVEPNCYNCNINSKDSKCCNNQMQAIKKGTVKYMSPDYIFNNDENDRKQNERVLNNLGLKINPSI